MKKNALLVFLSLTTGSWAFGGNAIQSDTTFHYKNQIVQIQDSIDQVTVKIFEPTSPDDNRPGKQVYEGLFSDERNYSRWSVTEKLGFNLPFFGRKKTIRHGMNPHWGGWGLGFAKFTDQPLSLNTFKSFNSISVDGYSLRAEKSNELMWNFSEKTLPLFRSCLGLTTGLGFDWRNYWFDLNTHLVELNGLTVSQPAPEGIHYLKSRLRTVYLTAPLLLEWQPRLGNDHHFFINGGVIGGIRTLSSFKVKYEKPDGKNRTIVENRDLNVSPLMLDYFAQAGYKAISLYGKYSPYSIFQNNKGPKVHAISLGLIIDLNFQYNYSNVNGKKTSEFSWGKND